MSHKNGKWAEEILALQREDGTWGTMFHSLAAPTKKYPLTTEQALRRLRILGFTVDDTPIRRAVDLMDRCLRGERKIDDYWEKTHDWALFTSLMLSTWVRLFDPANERALAFARRWAEVVEKTFAGGAFDRAAYTAAYADQFSAKQKGAREIDFVDFYHLTLVRGLLRPETEGHMLDYVLSKPDGIYYIYDKPLNQPPTIFTSKKASQYLAALELLADYPLAREKLGFALDWLESNRGADGQWDFGSEANDKLYFPLSDSWRKAEERQKDCTERVAAFLQKLKV